MQKPFSGVALIISGVVFIVLGVLIVMEPRILVWVMAAAFVLLGVMVLMMVSFMRKMFPAIPKHE